MCSETNEVPDDASGLVSDVVRKAHGNAALASTWLEKLAGQGALSGFPGTNGCLNTSLIRSSVLTHNIPV